MINAAIFCLWVCIVGPAQQIEYARQWERPSHLLFENKDFWVVRLSEFSDPKLQNETFSGLLLLQSGGGKIDYDTHLWKLSGGQADADKYYWASSAKADRLTSIEAAGPGFLVVPKSGDKLNKKIFNANLPRPFKESVGDDISLIAALVESGNEGSSPSQLQQDRARAGLEDMLFKSRWISSGEQVNASSNPLVGVTARTLDHAGTVVQHCDVWYVPIAWEDDKQHWKRFDRFSSPTTQSIVVGQYKMWASHNGKDGNKVPVNPGDDEQPTKNVDLDVP
jgi:hypothetical protein